MEKILGLDLGTNSIGWAIRELNNELPNQIIDKGTDNPVRNIKVSPLGQQEKENDQDDATG